MILIHVTEMSVFDLSILRSFYIPVVNVSQVLFEYLKMYAYMVKLFLFIHQKMQESRDPMIPYKGFIVINYKGKNKLLMCSVSKKD